MQRTALSTRRVTLLGGGVWVTEDVAGVHPPEQHAIIRVIIQDTTPSQEATRLPARAQRPRRLQTACWLAGVLVYLCKAYNGRVTRA